MSTTKGRGKKLEAQLATQCVSPELNRDMVSSSDSSKTVPVKRNLKFSMKDFPFVCGFGGVCRTCNSLQGLIFNIMFLSQFRGFFLWLFTYFRPHCCVFVVPLCFDIPNAAYVQLSIRSKSRNLCYPCRKLIIQIPAYNHKILLSDRCVYSD